MLITEDYREEILRLHAEGKTGREIQKELGFKNHQPVYNFLKKNGLIYNPRKYHRKYKLNEDYFKVINTEEKAYILGFLCADGHISNYGIEFDISQKDINILHHIRRCLNSNSPIVEYLSENPYHNTNRKILGKARVRFNSIELIKPLLSMGLTTDKTYTLNSSIINYVPKYLIRHFLRGYFDGDGNVLYGKRYSSGVKYNINICGNSEFLLKTFQVYFPSNNKLYYDINSKQCYIWKLSSKENVTNFLKFLYENSSIRLTRKYKIYLKSKTRA